MLREDFRTELGEVDRLLEEARSRLTALVDLATYDDLPREVIGRIQAKRNVIDLTRDQLAEIPEMVKPRGART